VVPVEGPDRELAVLGTGAVDRPKRLRYIRTAEVGAYLQRLTAAGTMRTLLRQWRKLMLVLTRINASAPRRADQRGKAPARGDEEADRVAEVLAPVATHKAVPDQLGRPARRGAEPGAIPIATSNSPNPTSKATAREAARRTTG
jgi:hypothetical protein